jgi:hypothetical protein
MEGGPFERYPAALAVDTLYVMSTCRYRAVAAPLVASLVLAACTPGGTPSASTQPAGRGRTTAASPSPSAPAAKLGVPFRSRYFEVTATRVETGVRQLDIADDAKARGLKPWTPQNGQYILVHLTVKNLGNAPASYSTTRAGLVDDAGRTYISAILVGGAPPVGQGLGDTNVQPGASATGFLVFDVPTSAGTPTTLVAQPGLIGAVMDTPKTVSLRS